MIKRLKHIASYLYPLRIEQCIGKVSPYLEVNLVQGRYVLDSAKANYSHGSLHWVFDEAFKDFKLNDRQIKNALILGFGAGSVASLLAEKYCVGCEMTGVEKDPIIIKLAHKYFDIQRFKNLHLVNDDASNYVQTHRQSNKFDLIVVDIYIDDQVPRYFQQKTFLRQLDCLLRSNGILFFNKVANTPQQKGEYEELASSISEIFGPTLTYQLTRNGTINNMLIHDKKSI